jgi:DNA invertase Pin-like site-specific DNA recombinase
MTPAAAPARPHAAVGYVGPMPHAVPTPSLRRQRLDIQRACSRLGLELVEVCGDETDARAVAAPRHGLERALGAIHTGGAACLVVGGLEQLGADTRELSATLARLERAGARLVAVDVGFDSATATGRLALGRSRPDAAWAGPREAGPPEAGPPEAPEAGRPEGGSRQVAGEAPPPRLDGFVPAAAPESAPQTDAGEAPDGPAAGAPEPAAPTPAQAVAALGYASVPADGGDAEGIGAQRRAIEAICAARGLRLVELVGDREPNDGKALDRAGLSHTLQRIAAGDARCLVVGSLDRLSRSVAELGTIVQWLERNEVRLVAADLGLDTSTEAGRMTARTLASVAGWERERLSERTQKGLAAARAKRHDAAGAAGPDWPALRRRIAGMRADGMTLQAIADVLNAEGVPTQRGGLKWRPSSVQTAAGYRRRTRPRTLDELPRVPPAPRTDGPSPADG